MGTTSQKLEYLNTTKIDLKDAINLMGTNITNDTFRSYPSKIKSGLLDIMNNGIETTWNNWEKVTGTGTSVSLNNTVEAPMNNSVEGRSVQNGTPSPSSEVPINSVGDNVNLADFSIGQVPSISNGALVNLPGGACTDFIEIDKNYYFTYTKAQSTTSTQYIMFYDSNKDYLGYVSGILSGYSLNSSTYYASAKYVRLRLDIYTDYSNVKLGIDTVYSPYNMGVATIEKCNKNLFDISTILEGYLIRESDGAIVSNANFNTSDFIKIENQTYILSWSSTSNYFQAYVYQYDKNKNYISRINITKSTSYSNTFTPSSNEIEYIRISYSITVQSEPAPRTNIQLELRLNTNLIRCTPKHNIPYLYTSTNAFYRRCKR